MCFVLSLQTSQLLLHLDLFNLAIQLRIRQGHYTTTNFRSTPLITVFSLCVWADRSVWPRRRVRRCSSAAVKETIAMRSSHTCQKPSLLQVNQPSYVTSQPCGPFFRIFCLKNICIWNMLLLMIFGWHVNTHNSQCFVKLVSLYKAMCCMLHWFYHG